MSAAYGRISSSPGPDTAILPQAAWLRARLAINVQASRITITPDFGVGERPGSPSDLASIVDAVMGSLGALAARGSDDVRFDLRIEVPAALPEGWVTVQSASGQIRLAGIGAARIIANAASGAISAEACGSDVKLNTASGQIVVARAFGQCAAQSASGAIDLLSTRPLALTAESASGAIRLQVAQEASGDLRLKSVSGAVDIEASPRTAVAVSTRSVSGRVKVDPSFAGDDRSTWQRGDSPAVTITVKTVSGAVRLRDTKPADVGATPPQAGDEAPTEPDRAPGHEPDRAQVAPAHEEEDAILRAVERGEIGVDEALRRLDERDGGASSPAAAGEGVGGEGSTDGSATVQPESG